MAFAIFYNLADLQSIATLAQRVDIPNADRQFLQSCWQSGLNQWQAGVPAPATHDGPPVGDASMVVVTGNHQGQPITLAQFRAMLTKYGAQIPLLRKLAEDMGRFSGAAEPWP